MDDVPVDVAVDAATDAGVRPRSRAGLRLILERLCVEHDFDKAIIGTGWTLLDIERRRDRDAAFAADLVRARRIDAQRLETALVNQARDGVLRTIALGSGKSDVTRDYDARLALGLLARIDAALAWQTALASASAMHAAATSASGVGWSVALATRPAAHRAGDNFTTLALTLALVPQPAFLGQSSTSSRLDWRTVLAPAAGLTGLASASPLLFGGGAGALMPAGASLVTRSGSPSLATATTPTAAARVLTVGADPRRLAIGLS